jgi:hypothetical protein
MKANHLQRSGDVMSVSASRAWIGGPITDSGDPTQLGRMADGRQRHRTSPGHFPTARHPVIPPDAHPCRDGRT